MSTTPITPVLADLLYAKSREQLLQIEDAEYSSLRSQVADYYPTQVDYTIWGSNLRAVAMELARLSYMYSYDMVSVEAKFLTPPDIKRRWADPLFINSSFPAPGQSDLAYRDMLVALLKAYPQGATVKTIEAVIKAYTGQDVEVIEFFKQVGNGVVTMAQANTLGVTLDASTATGTTPFSAIQAASALATLSQDLYGAIDLAKPAHIGLDFAITFGDGEDLSTLISGITDTLEIILTEVEPSPLPEVFTLSPFTLPTSPDTTLSAFGASVGSLFQQTITADQFANLMSADFQAEYTENADGTFSLVPGATQDVILVDANNNPTGAISRARGVLAPQLSKSWEIKGDSVVFLRLS
jgi:hypothetical protein